MAKSYVIQMREQGHDDASIKQHMVAHGWQPSQVDALFIEMGHVADATAVQPPNSELVKTNTSARTQGVLHIRYEANPIDTVRSSIRMVRRNMQLVGIWSLSIIVTITAAIAGMYAALYVFEQFPAIAFFGITVAEPVDVIVFLVVLLTILWLVVGVVWSASRAIANRALIQVLAEQPLPYNDLFSGSTAITLRVVASQTLLYMKIILLVFIPTVVMIFIDPELSTVGFVAGLLAGFIIYVRNAFTPFIHITDPSAGFFEGSRKSNELVLRPDLKVIEILGWIGLSSIATFVGIVFYNLLTNVDTLVSLTGVRVLPGVVWVGIHAVGIIIHDIGVARLYLGAAAIDGPVQRARRSYIINILLFLLGATAYVGITALS